MVETPHTGLVCERIDSDSIAETIQQFFTEDKTSFIEGIQAEKKKNLSGEEDEEPGLDRTISLIDAFLSTIPEESENAIGFDYATDYTTYLENDMPVGDEQPATDAPRLKGQDLIDGFIARNDAESLWVKKQMLAAEPAAVEPIPATQEELIAQEPEQPEEDETDVPDEEIDSTTDPETEQIEVETFLGEEDEDEEEYYNEEEDEEPQSLVATSEGGGRRRPPARSTPWPPGRASPKSAGS